MTSLRSGRWKMTQEKGHHAHDKAQALEGVEMAD